MADFTVREGDNFTISDVLEDANGNPVNIQAATVKLTVIPVAGGTPLLAAVSATNDQFGDGSDGSKGKVHYAGSAAAGTAGMYLLSWLVLFGGTSPQTYPNGGYILFEVTADAPITAATRFAESVDLERRLGITFTADEHVRAAGLLDQASQLIKDETRQDISVVTADVLTRNGSYDTRIRLPQRPVVSITSVVLDGVTMDPTSYYLDRDELVRRNWSAAIIDSAFGRPFAGWGFPWSTLVITYTHGFATVPGIVKQICMEAVVRVWVNPGSAIQEATGNQQATYAPYSDPPRGLLLTDAERRALRKRVGRPSGSIQLR